MKKILSELSLETIALKQQLANNKTKQQNTLGHTIISRCLGSN